MRPALILKWPGAVPIHPKCEACNGEGHKVYGAETRRWLNKDLLIDCTAHFGNIVICARCTGWGHLTRYGERGRSFTPIIRPQRRIFTLSPASNGET